MQLLTKSHDREFELMLIQPLQRQGHTPEKDQEDPQEQRHRRQEVADRAEEDECPADSSD